MCIDVEVQQRSTEDDYHRSSNRMAAGFRNVFSEAVCLRGDNGELVGIRVGRVQF